MVWLWEACAGNGWCADGFVESEIAATRRPDDVKEDDTCAEKQTKLKHKSLMDDHMDETLVTAHTIHNTASGISARSKNSRKSARSGKIQFDNIEITASAIGINTIEEAPEAVSVSSASQSDDSVSLSSDQAKAARPSETKETSVPVPEENEEEENVPAPEDKEKEEDVPVPILSKTVSFATSVKSARSAESRLSDIISLQSSASSGYGGPVKELMAYRKQVEAGLMTARSDAESSADLESDAE